jgi:cyclophilin family peptidyl-prolyl cis-trans isomerase/HEAT repeat protein
MKKSIGILIIACMLSACTDKGLNKFSDPTLVKIADFQDRRLSDSLYAYFKHKNPTYRKEAVLAFASIQDTSAIEQLGTVLRFDADPEVRKRAAIALGQMQIKLSRPTLWKALQEEKNPVVLREIIESCGKTFGGGDIDHLNITSTDSLVQEGLAWAYYRLGLRNKIDSAIIVKSIEFLKPAYGYQTRLAAANFFMRGVRQIPQIDEAQLLEAAQHDKSPLVRATVTLALRKVKSAAVLDALKKILKADVDYRVRISAANSLKEFPIAETKLNLYEALNDSNINVAIAASEVILAIATAAEANEIASLAKNTTQIRVRGNLYEASLTGSDSTELVSQIIELYKSESNSYGKAALLTALGKSKEAWRFIDEELHKSTIPVIKSSAAGALVAINDNPSFESSRKKEYAELYKRAIQTGDAAVIGTVTDALRDPRLGYKEVITDYTFLYEAKKKLSLPKDNEALQPLEAAIAYFEGKKKADPVKNEFNHPIDWELVKTIPKDQKVLIKTDKGDIVLRLLVEEAPGSVANFVQLVTNKYFDSKNFHRVVPNFVIQGGCNRGDGWGSEDYSIRSEFTDRHYIEGSVGMASAGKDTEGTQWFITHSPTPHLDGRYSIFAITESGMDVVHRIEVGDKIVSVTLIK